MLSTFLKEYAYSLQGSILIQFLKYYLVFFLGFMVDNILWVKLNLYKLYDRYFIDKNFYVTNVKIVYYNLNNQLKYYSHLKTLLLYFVDSPQTKIL